MNNNKERIKELLEKYQLGIISDEEIELLSNLTEIEEFNAFVDDFESGLLGNLE